MKAKNNIKSSNLTGMVRFALASLFIAVMFASCSKDESATPAAAAPAEGNRFSSSAKYVDPSAIASYHMGDRNGKGLIYYVNVAQPTTLDDGSIECQVTFTGKQGTAVIGQKFWTISGDQFKQALSVLLDNGFMGFKDKYPNNGKQHSILSINYADLQKSVEDFAILTPPDLDAIRAKMEFVLGVDPLVKGF